MSPPPTRRGSRAPAAGSCVIARRRQSHAARRPHASSRPSQAACTRSSTARSRSRRRSRGRARPGRSTPALAGSNSRSSLTFARACSSGASARRSRTLARSIARIRSKSSKSSRPDLAGRALERDAPRPRGRGGARVGRLPTCQAPVPALSSSIALLQARLRDELRASRPRRSASGRCCPGRRTGCDRRRSRAYEPHPGGSPAAQAASSLSRTLTPPRARAPPGTPPGAPPRGPPASSASCPPSASRAAFACA